MSVITSSLYYGGHPGGCQDIMVNILVFVLPHQNVMLEIIDVMLDIIFEIKIWIVKSDVT